MTVTLSSIGNFQTATFEVTNPIQSKVKAIIDSSNAHIYEHGTTTDFSSEYFDVKVNIYDDIEIPAGSSALFTVTATMKNAVDGTDVTGQFDIVLSDIEKIK